MQVVIVTAWRRPAFLLACLDRLVVAARGRDDLRFILALDRGASHEVVNIATRWTHHNINTCRARLVRRTGHGYKGNSFNVLTAYREALTHKPTLVHLVEDDILVGADYFDYHDRAHALVPDAFSVSACRNQQFLAGHEPDPDPAAVFTHPAYQSIGVSLKPARLQAAMPHAVGPYFAQPVRYCQTRFPHTAINVNNAEQDGLLHRLSEQAGLVSVYPAVPRAYHAGFTGYHRKGEELAGTTRQQADQLLAMDADEMNRRAHRYKDHTTVPLDAPREPVSRLVRWP